jgi:hypothetical protein
MTSRLKKWAATTVPALALLFAASAANAQQGPQCFESGQLDTILSQQTGDVPTQDVAKDVGPWSEIRIYADPADGSWSLVAKPGADLAKAIGVPDGVGASCYLGGGDSGYPDEVKKDPGFQQLFGPK